VGRTLAVHRLMPEIRGDELGRIARRLYRVGRHWFSPARPLSFAMSVGLSLGAFPAAERTASAAGGPTTVTDNRAGAPQIGGGSRFCRRARMALVAVVTVAIALFDLGLPSATAQTTAATGLADIYVINADGTLSCYQHYGYLDGSSLWQKDGGLVVGNGWKDFKQVFSVAGAIYAIQADGTLLWYQHNGYATCAAQPWSGPRTVASGWQNFKQVFPMTTSSGNGAIIYAVTTDGTLQWYQHLGYADGSMAWSGPKSVGTGWQNFKQVFSTGDGIIYAIQNDGILQWYQHLGYADGSTALSGPKSVGSGWQNFLGAFLRSPAPGAAHCPQIGSVCPAPGPDSPIPPRLVYATTGGKLYVMVDASTDKTANWLAQATEAPPLAGVNWSSFPRVFAGGDGVIYGVDAFSNLHYFRLLDPWRNPTTPSGAQLRWSPDSNTVINAGWGRLPTLSVSLTPLVPNLKASGFARLADQNSTSLVSAIWSPTDVTFYKHGWLANGAVDQTWTNGGVPQPGTYHPPAVPDLSRLQAPTSTFEGGNGITYIVDGAGILYRYRVHPDGTEPGPLLQIGNGSTLSNLTPLTVDPGDLSIEGYISTMRPVPNSQNSIATLSVAPGDTVKVRASTFSPTYTVQLMRLQRHTQDDRTFPSGLIDGVPVTSLVTRQSQDPDGNFKKAENFTMYTTGAGWSSDGADIQVPPNAAPGIYGAELKTPSGGRFVAPFVVKPASPLPVNTDGSLTVKIAVIANTNTWNAYNGWGGSSRYFSTVTPEVTSTVNQKPVDLSYERPVADMTGDVSALGLNNRDPLAYNHLVRAEVWVTTWLDRLASENAKYAYDMYSDVDLDQAPLGKYAVVILSTHPEYWSDSMRTNLEAYLKAGGHLIYVGGNGLYDRVTITPDGKMRLQNGVGGSTCTGPAFAPCPARDLFRFATSSFPDGRSERAVLGLAYETALSYASLTAGHAYTMVSPPHPFLTSQTYLKVVGDTFGGRAGLNHNLPASAWEVNRFAHDCGFFPNGNCTSSHTTEIGTLIASDGFGSDWVYRQTNSGSSGWVFAGGSITTGGVLALDQTLQRIVNNALDSAIDGILPAGY
jgi:hypothetical protein